MENNKLIVLDNFEIDKLSNDDCGYILWYNKFVIKPAVEKIEKRLKASTLARLDIINEKGNFELSISKPTPAGFQIKSEPDWTAIINFGIKNKLQIPMTYDYDKMKETKWVQDLLNDTAFWQSKKVPKRAFNGSITITEKKGK